MIEQKIEANKNVKKVIKMIGNRIYNGEFGKLEEPLNELINSNEFAELDLDVKVTIKEFLKESMMS